MRALMNDEVVTKRIAQLVQSLNGELKMAYELGLRVTLTPRSFARSYNAPEELSVRVWREVELLRQPPKEPLRIIDLPKE